MRLLTIFGVAVACLSLGVVGLSHQVRAELALAETDLDAAPQPVPRELMPGDPGYGENLKIEGIEEELHGGRLFDSSVVEVTRHSITVFFKGRSGWVESLTDDVERRWESIPPRRIKLPLSKDLEEGKLGEGCLEWDKDAFYPISMVEVGDRVELKIVVQNDWYVCAGIIIWRRPGGRVPCSPWDEERDAMDRLSKALHIPVRVPRSPREEERDSLFRIRGTHHYEAANALQDLEEKGIPLPRKYESEKDNLTLPPHLRGKMAYPGIVPTIMPDIIPALHGAQRLFR